MTEEKRYRIPDAEYEDGWRTVTEEEYEDALEKYYAKNLYWEAEEGSSDN